MTTKTVELVSPANELTQQCINEVSSMNFQRRQSDGEYKTYNYWSYISDASKNYLISTWNNFPVTYKGVGVCASRLACYGGTKPRYLFDYTVNPMSQLLVDRKVIENACMDCICSAFFTVNASEDFIQQYDSVHNRMLPDSLFVHDETPECACGFPIVSDDNQDFNSSWRGVEAIIDREEPDNVQMIHQRCAFECAMCENTFDYNNATRYEADDKHYCEECWNEVEPNYCEQCDEYTFHDTYYSQARSIRLCQEHYDSYLYCDGCNDEYHEDDGHDCENSTALIHSYGYKPTPLFFPDSEQPYYMGIELEVEVKNNNKRSIAEYVTGWLGSRAYLKNDGSLDNGFEIVTHPHTLDEYHNLDWSFLEQLKRMGVRSWNPGTCGLHVHVGKVAFDSNYPATDKHLIRFNKFIYDNEQQVTRIAGRTSDFAKFQDKGDIIRKVKYTRQSAGRYSAVNLEPEYTAEVRVFRGSLRKERVLSGIEFVHAAVEFTRDMKIVPKQVPFSWARFVTYVTTHQDTYPNLFIILNETFARNYDENEES